MSDRSVPNAIRRPLRRTSGTTGSGGRPGFLRTACKDPRGRPDRAGQNKRVFPGSPAVSCRQRPGPCRERQDTADCSEGWSFPAQWSAHLCTIDTQEVCRWGFAESFVKKAAAWNRHKIPPWFVDECRSSASWPEGAGLLRSKPLLAFGLLCVSTDGLERSLCTSSSRSTCRADSISSRRPSREGDPPA